MNLKRWLPLAVLFVFFSQSAKPVISEEPLLATLLHVRESVVRITAEAGGAITKAPELVPGPNGKMLALRSIKPIYLKREGAGVILTEWGLIVTNAHTVDNSGRITVTLDDETKHEARLEHLDHESDVAFLRIMNQNPLHAVKLSEAAQINFNSEVYSIGNSKFLNNTLSSGSIRGKKTIRFQSGENAPLIEIGMDTYHGDSGTPVLDKEGSLLGIVASGSPSRHASYAIPVNTIRKQLAAYLESLKKPEVNGGTPPVS